MLVYMCLAIRWARSAGQESSKAEGSQFETFGAIPLSGRNSPFGDKTLPASDLLLCRTAYDDAENQ